MDSAAEQKHVLKSVQEGFSNTENAVATPQTAWSPF